MPVEALVGMGHGDVQGFLDPQFFVSSSLVEDGSLATLEGMLGVPDMLYHCRQLHVPLSVCISVFLQPGLQSLCSLVNVDLVAVAREPVHNLGA